MKKVLIVSSSPRKNGNSEILANEAAKGAKDAGNEVEVVLLRDKTVNFCRGCLACQKLLKCVINDDMAALVEKLKAADAVIFATPIYYYEMSGQLKTFLDRCNPIYPQEYAFRDVYLLSSSAEEGQEPAARAVSGLKGWIECFEKARFAGAFNAGGVTMPNDVLKYADMLKAAYDMGGNV